MGWLKDQIFGNNKTEQETSINNELINKTVFNVLNTTSTNQQNSILVKQKLDVGSAYYICQNANMKQIANLEIKVLNKFEGTDSVDLVDDIMNDLDADIDADIEQVTSFLNVGGDNESSTKTDIKTSITNDLQKNITNETINSLANEIIVNQEFKIENLVVDPCAKYSGVKIAEKLMEEGKLSFTEFMDATKNKCDAECGTIGQDVQIKFVAEQITNKMNEVIGKNKMIQDLRNKVKIKQKQESKGLGDALNKILKGIGDALSKIFNSATLPFLISACVACVIIIAVAAFALSPSGQKLANKAGSRIR